MDVWITSHLKLITNARRPVSVKAQVLFSPSLPLLPDPPSPYSVSPLLLSSIPPSLPPPSSSTSSLPSSLPPFLVASISLPPFHMETTVMGITSNNILGTRRRRRRRKRRRKRRRGRGREGGGGGRRGGRGEVE